MATTAGNPEKSRRVVHRSPSYPSMPLEEALQKVRMVYAEDKRAWTSRSVILKHLGFTDEKSGPANRSLSALRQYGLLEERDGQLRVSDTAYTALVLSDSSPEKPKKIAEAALNPKIFKELWSIYGPDLASDETMADFLIHKKEFNPASAPEVVSAFRKTIAFAKLQESATIDSDEHGAGIEGTHLKVGDYVQWESQGMLQFADPRRIREISPDGQWAFVDGSDTGMAVTELELAERPETATSPTRQAVDTRPRPRTFVEAQQLSGQFVANQPDPFRDVFSSPEGSVMIQWPASISKETFDDLSAWLDIVKRKIGRSVKPVGTVVE